MSRPHINILLDDIRSPMSRDTLAEYSLDGDKRENLNPESLAARARLRTMLSAATDSDPKFWAFPRRENGKPEAHFNGKPTPFAVSLSHSGPFFACAFAEAEALGIDIEQHKDWRDLENIAGLAFGPEERRMVETEGAGAFYRIWTLREAHAKATGLGLEQAADGKDRFATATGKDGKPAGFTLSDADGTWHFRYERPIPELSLAVAVRCPVEPVWTSSCRH